MTSTKTIIAIAIIALIAINANLAKAGMICVPSPDPPSTAPVTSPVSSPISSPTSAPTSSPVAAPVSAPVSSPISPPSPVAPTPSPSPITGIKFHPGHYFTIYKSMKYNPSYLTQVSNDLANTAALRGLQVKFNWRELESTQGKYNWTGVDMILNRVKAAGKQLTILMEIKTFSPTEYLTFLPDYLLQNPIYEGGVQAYSTFDNPAKKGDVIKIWNPNVFNRFDALLKAFGARYDQNKNFEGIGFSESTIHCVVAGCPGDALFFQKLMAINGRARTYFPHSLVYQFTNYPPGMLAYQAEQLPLLANGWGGPNIFKDDPGLNAPGRAFQYYSSLSGIVPILPSVQSADYVWTAHAVGGPNGHEPTVSELLVWARDGLKANYLFWDRANFNGRSYFTEVLNLLNQPAQKSKAPSGGLKTACPSTYASRGGCFSS